MMGPDQAELAVAPPARLSLSSLSQSQLRLSRFAFSFVTSVMAPQVFLITGGDHGPGLDLVKRLLATDLETVVIAAVRALAEDDELAGMERRQPGRLERVEMDTVSFCREAVKPNGRLNRYDRRFWQSQADPPSVAAAAAACSHLCFAKRGIDVVGTIHKPCYHSCCATARAR